MKIIGWKYYNHAALPNTAPHEQPDITPIEDGTIWQLDGSPLLARWTTDFDCGYETNWWYVIRKAPFDMEEIPSKEKKSIRQALRKSNAKKVKMSEYAKELYKCYFAAVEKYENSYSPMSETAFVESCRRNEHLYDCWAGFSEETGDLIGYMTVMVHDEYCEIVTAKFHPDFYKLQVSDTMYYEILNFYLNTECKKYICSGERSINHVTGTQDYKIRRFLYEKVYCRLNIRYNPKILALIKVMYPMRGFLKLFDKIRIVHQFNSVLKMEELRRENVENE